MDNDDWKETGDELVPDAVFELLAHYRRRRLVVHLREHGEPLSLADAAEAIAVDERDSAIDEIPPEDVKEIYMTLYHNHVPKLEDFGVATYLQERDLVAPGKHLDSLESHLKRFDDGR